MQIKTFTVEQWRDPHWLNSSVENRIGDHRAQKVADAGWAPIRPANDPDPSPAGKALGISTLVGGLTLLLEASRTPHTTPFRSENNPAFPAISESSGSMLGLIAVVVMLLLIGLAYIAGKVCRWHAHWKSSAQARHAPAHPPPNRASA